eukprot:sb/3472405/
MRIYNYCCWEYNYKVFILDLYKRWASPRKKLTILALAPWEPLVKIQNEHPVYILFQIFGSIIKYPCFAAASIILFLNKKDLFAEKVQVSHIRDHHPSYNGPEKNADAGMTFFGRLFGAKFSECAPDGKDTLFVHYTCAVDRDNMKKIYAAIKDTLLANNLEEFALT